MRSEGLADTEHQPLEGWRQSCRWPILSGMQVFESHTPPVPEPDSAPSSQSPVTVVVADDHPLFREGLARAIARHPELKLVGEATDGVGALSLIQDLEPDIALLDLKMLGLDGIEVCARVTAKGLRTRVVLLSAFLGPQLVSRAVEAGAAGYLGKDASREEIFYGVVETARGGAAFRKTSPTIRPGLSDGAAWS